MKNTILILFVLISTSLFAQQPQKDVVDSTQFSVAEIKKYSAILDSIVQSNPYVIITYKSAGFVDTQIEMQPNKKVNARVEALIPVYEWKAPTYTQDQLFGFIKQEKAKSKNVKK